MYRNIFNNYHVLSNYDIGEILTIGLLSYVIIWLLFAYLAGRDASKNQPKKGWLGKIVPWLLFGVLLSNICLLIYRFCNYPWGIEPQPSQASIFREVEYLGSGYPIWGWANDYQLLLLRDLSHCLLCFGWMIYAFDFKQSNTTWWKKGFKVLAYIIISGSILGFSLHEYRDLWAYLIILVAVVILLWMSHVKPFNQKEKEVVKIKKETEVSIVPIEETSTEPTIDTHLPKEDYSRYKPSTEKSEKTQDLVSVYNSITTPIDSDEFANDTNKESANTNSNLDIVSPEKEQINVNNEAKDNIINLDNNVIGMMYCKYCGKRIEEDSTFCKYCGKRLL